MIYQHLYLSELVILTLSIICIFSFFSDKLISRCYRRASAWYIIFNIVNIAAGITNITILVHQFHRLS